MPLRWRRVDMPRRYAAEPHLLFTTFTLIDTCLRINRLRYCRHAIFAAAA